MSDSHDLKVVPLPPRTAESEALREALSACSEQASRGDVTAFVLVTLKRNGAVMRAHGRSDDADVFKLLGVLNHEARHLSQRIDEQDRIIDHLDPKDAA